MSKHIGEQKRNEVTRTASVDEITRLAKIPQHSDEDLVEHNTPGSKTTLGTMVGNDID